MQRFTAGEEKLHRKYTIMPSRRVDKAKKLRATRS